MQDLTSQLGLEQDAAAELRRTMARINADLQQAFLDRDELSADLGESEAARGAARRADGGRDPRPGADAAHAGGDARAGRARRGCAGPSSSASSPRRGRRSRPTRSRSSCSSASWSSSAATSRRCGRCAPSSRREVAELGTSLARTDEERRRLLAELGSTRDRASALEARLAEADQKTVLAQRELDGARAAHRGAAAQLARARGAGSAARRARATTPCGRSRPDRADRDPEPAAARRWTRRWTSSSRRSTRRARPSPISASG